MGHVQDKLKKSIAEAAAAPVDQVKLEHPAVEEHEDYSTNIALVLKGGRKLAEEISGRIEKGDLIEKVEIAGPGFINIRLKNEYLIGEREKVVEEKEAYGGSDLGKGKKVVVEYSSPNIAREFSVGHLRSTIIGQSLYNIYKLLGYEVIGDNHLGDWGTQFGKLMYMINEKRDEDLTLEKLQVWYVEFHQLAKERPELEAEGQKWFKRLEDGDARARDLWRKCVDISLAEFERIYKLLGVSIDNSYGESSYEGLMPEVIEEAKEKKVAKLSEGAWVIEVPGEEAPLILVKSDGGTTYATRDLATVKFRRKKWDPELMIYEVGGEQSLHFRQIFAAAQMLGYVRDGTSLIHTKHGLYLAPDGKKFSTRQGKTVKLEEVLEEAIDRAKKLGSETKEGATAVGIGAIKYFDLLHNVQSDIVFDWGKVMNLEGNSGPYLQYTFARTQSVLAKTQMSNVKCQIKNDLNYTLNTEELHILRYLYRFPEVVEEAARRYSPNLICNYLYELAQKFNTFYNQHSILSADNDYTKKFRLNLTKAVGQILKNGMGLLGITALEKM
jgi:arginyl-tRNA synthetase